MENKRVSDIVIGVSSQSYNWKDLSEAFRRAYHEFDLNAIELSFNSSGMTNSLSHINENDNSCHLNENNLREIRDLKEAYEGKISLSLHAWLDIPKMKEEDAKEELKRISFFSSRAGINHVIAHLGSHPEKAKGLNIIKRVLSQAVLDYEKLEVKLCLENHWPFKYKNSNELGDCPEDFLEIFSVVKSPYLGFCIDYGHANMTGNILSFINQLAPYLSYAHVNDNFGGDDQHLAFGEGNVNWRKTLRSSLAVGFKGPYILEYQVKNNIKNNIEKLFYFLTLKS